MHCRVRTLRLVGALAVIAGCTGASSTRGAGVPVVGAWNGRHASIVLSDSGGSIEYDCGHGGLRAAVRPDGDGQFSTPGVHVREHGGPMRLGEVPDSVPARYVGRVRGREMALRVVVGADTLGPFTLRRDGPSQLVKCL